MRRAVLPVLVLLGTGCVVDGDEVEPGSSQQALGADASPAAGEIELGPLIVFDNGARVFRWWARCDCVEYVEGRYLDLRRAPEDQDNVPRRSSIELFKVDPSIGNITEGGFWFRSARVAGESAFFAARKPFVIQGNERDVTVIPPRKKQVGDTVGPDDTWVNGEPSSLLAEAGVQTAHFHDLSGETGPDQLWFRDGILGVRFRIQGAIHYGFVELDWSGSSFNLFPSRYRAVRWGYNTTPDEPLVIPP